MPKVKSVWETPQIVRLINSCGYTQGELCEILKCSRPTLRDKMKNPTKFTLGDLQRLNVKGGIPIEEIREAIKW